MTKHKILSVEELRKLRPPICNANLIHQDNFSKLEKFAMFVTSHVGTMGFFLIIFSWTVLWLSWNALAPKSLVFDPFPAFVLWLFISNMIQLFLLPLMMVGQNLQGRHSELRAETEFQINIKAEQEVETILQHLENAQEQMQEQLRLIEGLRALLEKSFVGGAGDRRHEGIKENISAVSETAAVETAEKIVQ